MALQEGGYPSDEKKFKKLIKQTYGPQKEEVGPGTAAFIVQAETGKELARLKGEELEWKKKEAALERKEEKAERERKAAAAQQKWEAEHPAWKTAEKPKFRIEMPGAKAKREEREQILSQLPAVERAGYLETEARQKRQEKEFAEQQRTERGVRRQETVRRLLKYSPSEAIESKAAAATSRTMTQERYLATEQRLALARQQRQQVMPTAMQVIKKTPFEEQAQERAAPQGRDYSQFTQGVGMNIPSAAGGDSIGGVGERLGALLRPRVQTGPEVRPEPGSPEPGRPQGRDYGALFGTGGLGNRFGDILQGRKQVQPGQITERSIGDRFGDLLRGPMQAVPVRGKIAPKRMAAPKRVASPFAKLLNIKKNKSFKWFR